MLKTLLIFSSLLLLSACATQSLDSHTKSSDDFQVEADRFADLKVLRYRAQSFDNLTLEQKKLAYYLYEAALAGRDIMWDQNYKHNLRVRRTLEEIVKHYQGSRDTALFNDFMTYVKRVWFANGLHHHYSNQKIMPGFTFREFSEMAYASLPAANFPLQKNEAIGEFLVSLQPVIFDPKIDAKKVNKANGVDLVTTSAVNFYENVTEAEVDAFYKAKRQNASDTPVSYGLNSKLTKEHGKIVEKVWRVGGMYSAAIEKIVFWLKKAVTVAENAQQKKALSLLVEYYETGDLAKFDAYNIAWVADTESTIDVINGFIEVYNDPKAYRGSFESVVSMVDPVGTARISKIADNAQWFEDNSPIIDSHKKANVKGITGRSIHVLVETGDSSPSTPIGINLPNSNWIRANHGSKSVSLANIVDAYNSAPSKSLEEFAYNQAEIDRTRKYGEVSAHLHTDMHEVIGHASGTINQGIGTPKETLKQYASTMEEARADLVALYYLMDEKLIELGLMPSLEVGMVEYDSYIRNGMMTQLYRLKLGDHLEEDHMRNRQLVANWAYKNGLKDNVITKTRKNDKTYFVINDYQKLRTLFGQLLREMQRIKSEGDFEAARYLVETYGVKVDEKVHTEVLKRFEKLDVAPYSGFINPVLAPTTDANGNIVDVKIHYPADFKAQMLYYAKHHSLLPNYN